MSIKKRINSDNGFTLIELSMVLTLLGIILLLATPKYTGRIKQAELVSANNDAMMLSVSSKQYYRENENWPIGDRVKDAELLNIPASKALSDIYTISGTLLQEYVTLPKGNYEDYGLVTTGPYKGSVYLLNGMKDNHGNINFAGDITDSTRTHTVKFMDDEVVLYTQEVIRGDYVKLPKEPVRKGYKFDGWEDLPEKIDKDFNVYANWTKAPVIDNDVGVNPPVEKEEEDNGNENTGEQDDRAKVNDFLEKRGNELSKTGEITLTTDEDIRDFVSTNKIASEIGLGGMFNALKKHVYVGVDSNELIAGTKKNGYYGLVKSEELFTGRELAREISLEEGRRQYNESDWLKFSIDGRTIYKSKKPFRYSVEWEDIDVIGAAHGKKRVKKDGKTYSVRLMEGLNPTIGIKGGFESPIGATNNSEWNRLMMPISIKAKDMSFRHGVEYIGEIEYWGIDFTDEDLHVHESYGRGTYQWVQEYKGKNGSRCEDYRMTRGGKGVSHFKHFKEDSESRSVGWSPVLELIE